VCRWVERRFAWIAPIDPVNPVHQHLYKDSEVHEPVMAIARRAKPLYRPTPASRAIPVPLEISIAPIYMSASAPIVCFSTLHDETMIIRTRGAQPPLATFLTHSSCITALVNQTAAKPMRMTAMSGMGVSIVPTSIEPSKARMNRVKRSPRHVATGAVILSVSQVTFQYLIMRNSPGSIPNHLATTIIELIKLPNIALLNPALPIPVAKTITS